MEPTTIKSKPGLQKIISVSLTISGLFIITILINKLGNLNSDELAGFLLGCLIFTIGIVNLIINASQEICIDPNLRRITIKTVNNFKSKEEIIHFDEIKNIEIIYLGKKSNFTNFYYLKLLLNNDKTYILFSPGNFHISNRQEIEEWKSKIEKYISNN